MRASIGVGGVGGVAGGVVGRGKDRAGDKRLACDGTVEGGADDSGGVSHRGNGSMVAGLAMSSGTGGEVLPAGGFEWGAGAIGGD